MSNYQKRSRFYSEHLGQFYLSKKKSFEDFAKMKNINLEYIEECKKKNELPISPLITNLELENIEEMENLEIAPSEEFEKDKKNIVSYLSTNEEYENINNIPKSFLESEFLITFEKKKTFMKKKSKSFCKRNSCLTIFDFLLESSHQ